MPFPLNPKDGDVHIAQNNKYYIYKSTSGWVQEEPTQFFIQDARPTQTIDSSRIAIWFSPQQNNIYFWQDNDWVVYFTTKCN